MNKEICKWGVGDEVIYAKKKNSVDLTAGEHYTILEIAEINLDGSMRDIRVTSRWDDMWHRAEVFSYHRSAQEIRDEKIKKLLHA